ncbi:MAG: SGNH/GDSL hydrolase family protein [Anaerolineae bacterium]|nr:SGNH/GDSL hydrolase family protein [Anaerolineae bacterium]
MQEPTQPQMQTAPKAHPKRRALKTWAGRIAGVLFGLLLAWLLAEAGLRLLFFSLPPRVQLVLDEVYVTPWSDRRLMPDPIWQPDIDYLTITRPVQNLEQFGSAEVRFTVSTESLWGMRGAFRTRQDMVDRYVDAVAIGDSFTFCFTDEADCWVQQLARLTGRNIINFGVTSTGSVSHQRVLESHGLPLQPPLVLWQWYGNDANEDYGLALLRGETEVQSPNPAPPPPELNWWDEHSAVYVLLKLYLGSEDTFEGSLQFLDREYATQGNVELAFGRDYLWGAFDIQQPHNEVGWKLSTIAFLESRDMVEDYGGSLVIILMPTKEQVYRDMAEPLIGADKMALLDQNYDLMLDFCEQESLTCLDMLPVLQAHAAQGEQLFYTTDIHLNPLGNTVLAKAVANWLAGHLEVFDLASEN